METNLPKPLIAFHNISHDDIDGLMVTVTAAEIILERWHLEFPIGQQQIWNIGVKSWSHIYLVAILLIRK